MDRRIFLKIAGTAAAGLAADRAFGKTGNRTAKVESPAEKMKGHFTLLQISSVSDTIGNSYLIRTAGGKVIMIDGGFEAEQENLRQKIADAGNVVDLWFITHPHQDHMGALSEILADRRGMTIRKVIYSRCTDEVLKAETWAPQNETDAKRYYSVLDTVTEGTDITDLHTTGGRFDIDGIGIKVLGVANPELLMNSYNNNSMILRIWDRRKSVIILGDAGVECGDKALAAYPEWFTCDYLQMAHHGQNGCSREFYNNVKFMACLWPTPSWVWEPAADWIKTKETRKWMDDLGITEHHVSCLEKDWLLE
ncbi:MAG: MBL fold metallo-hydrolase [Bacteroidales bacterium]|nr:MBL fold metallo-hydrolase [Candidatus Equibacterium intestinale]